MGRNGHKTHGRKGKYRRGTGHSLLPADKEAILQTYTLTGNKAEVSRRLGFCETTVGKVIKELTKSQPAKVVEQRLAAQARLAGRVHHVTEEIIESIKPVDLESGLIKRENKDGKLVEAKSYGPGLVAKATAVGILTDKLAVLGSMRRQLMESGITSNGMPLPSDIEGLKRAIGNRVKSLRILDVQFADHNPEVTNRVQDVAQKAGLDKEFAEAAYEELNFDGEINERAD